MDTHTIWNIGEFLHCYDSVSLFMVCKSIYRELREINFRRQFAVVYPKLSKAIHTIYNKTIAHNHIKCSSLVNASRLIYNNIWLCGLDNSFLFVNANFNNNVKATIRIHGQKSSKPRIIKIYLFVFDKCSNRYISLERKKKRCSITLECECISGLFSINIKDNKDGYESVLVDENNVCCIAFTGLNSATRIYVDSDKILEKLV